MILYDLCSIDDSAVAYFFVDRPIASFVLHLCLIFPFFEASH